MMVHKFREKKKMKVGCPFSNISGGSSLFALVTMGRHLIILSIAFLALIAAANAQNDDAQMREKVANGISMTKLFAFRPYNNNCMVCTLLATMIGMTTLSIHFG
jgi:hypothetical protein